MLSALFIWISVAVAFADREEILIESPPEWQTGQSWTFKTEKPLDRTATQNAGVLVITTRLERIIGTTTYTVTGTQPANGHACYVLQVAGDQQITGRYSTTPIEGETITGNLVQQSTFEGKEYRRISDLAFVKASLHSKGTIEIGGALSGMPTPFNTETVMVANPPVQQFRFPLMKNSVWQVSSVVTTTSSGTTTDSLVNTYNYTCKVLGPRTITLDSGDSYDCIAVSQQGAQTTQSASSGISIEDITGNLFFAPSVGYFVKDEAEGQQLQQFSLRD